MTTAPQEPPAVEVTAFEARTAEVAQYQTNITLYTEMLANLPTAYPVHLLQYKGAADKHATIGTIEDLADVELLSDLWIADDCVKSIRTETLEMRKAQAILNVKK